MVLFRKIENEFFISKTDNIIHYDIEKCKEQILEIPEPILPENLTKGQIEVLKKEMRTVTSMEFSQYREYIVVSTENKQIIVYDKHFNIVKNIIIHRAASKVCFTSSNDILVADKTGDVYLYKISNEEDGPMLLLGHLSVILDMQISECGKYLITCDRDEKIRVSHFPNCYNIASYCLGHTEFITRLVIVAKLLISASGDGTVRFWNFVRGKQLGVINTHKYIDNKSLLEGFCLDMDKEKVEISALPITDIQVCSGDKLLIAVSVHRYNAIQLFSTDLNNFESQFIAKLCLQDPFVFCFSNNELYVLCNKLSCFKINDNFEIVERNILSLENISEKFQSYFVKKFEDTSITVLYKRKYDNVQEYLLRKKQRLDEK